MCDAILCVVCASVHNYNVSVMLATCAYSRCYVGDDEDFLTH